ncbi:hypothetical protein E6H31_03775 [Candidatus Bathyarchaeota archaeon]|nr:MAG: hypothetical protein E6H31_03775 [Candidatus Bathyarchaeota archaeon]
MHPWFNAVLERVQVKHWFKTVITGEDVERPKPDPERVLLALQGPSLSRWLVRQTDSADLG